MAEGFPSLVTRAATDSLKRLQQENLELKESNLIIKTEAEKLTCNLLIKEMEHSRMEDALEAELRNTRKEASDLRQKLHTQLQEKIDLESKLVPFRVKVADLEAAQKAEASRVEKIEKRSAEREVLLGKVEAERDKALTELTEARKETERIATELAQARELREELKKQAYELNQSAAQVLTAGFDAALEQMACQYLELDLSMLSICNEVVDGKIVPSED
ncbi:filament-like plant protein 1 [Phaseolus vulgaris]|uniref:filament-like plant protein 1 n=1 Tax=Phaseolus vulgaris TaxID=3885 RepID=UPI0035CA68FE